MTSHRLVGALLAAAAVAAGCGGSSGADDPVGNPTLNNGAGLGQSAAVKEAEAGRQTASSKQSAALTGPGAQSPYCTAAKELARREKLFYPPATSEDPYAAEDRLTFVKANEKLMDSVVRLAPGSLRSAVRTGVRALRGGAGLGRPVPRAQARAASARVNAYADTHC